MTDLIDTTEMYLRTIYELVEDNVVPMRARIAEHLGHSGPTVSQTVARMERDGLVVLREDRTLDLTDLGRETAVRVMRKHRLAERLLTDVVGLDLEDAHDEACRWEHVMSEKVERRLVDLLDSPQWSPYGNAIPALSDLGAADPAIGSADETPATDAGEEWQEAVVSRIGETAQAMPGLLSACLEVGVVPGAKVRVRTAGDSVEFQVAPEVLQMASHAARHVFLAGTLVSS